MMLKTHIAIAILFILLFWPSVTNKIIFSVTVIIATFLPDIDSAYTKIGNNFFAKILTAFTKHRGMFHSLTFCILLSVLFAIWIPVISFGFFLGYSLHILSDSFTKEGIAPFWPFRRISNWHFRTGGFTELSLFISFVIVDILVFVIQFTDIL